MGRPMAYKNLSTKSNFYRAMHYCARGIAIAWCPSVRPSVRPSVCLSVCLSVALHGGSIFIQIFVAGLQDFFSARVTLGRSRSSKVIDFGTNRKRVCTFLLVRYSNFGHISHRFRAIAGFLCMLMTTPTFTPNFWGIHSVVKLFSKYSNLCEKHTWTLQTDRQTDRETDDILWVWHNSALCIASRGKNDRRCKSVKTDRSEYKESYFNDDRQPEIVIMTIQTGSTFISESMIDGAYCRNFNGKTGFSTTARSKKVSPAHCINDRQPEIVDETGNTYIPETTTLKQLQFQR